MGLPQPWGAHLPPSSMPPLPDDSSSALHALAAAAREASSRLSSPPAGSASRRPSTLRRRDDGGDGVALEPARVPALQAPGDMTAQLHFSLRPSAPGGSANSTPWLPVGTAQPLPVVPSAPFPVVSLPAAAAAPPSPSAAHPLPRVPGRASIVAVASGSARMDLLARPTWVSKPSPAGARALSAVATATLRRWLEDPKHCFFPYPTLEEKLALAAAAGLTLHQVTVWFTNARKRFLVKSFASAPAASQNRVARHTAAASIELQPHRQTFKQARVEPPDDLPSAVDATFNEAQGQTPAQGQPTHAPDASALHHALTAAIPATTDRMLELQDAAALAAWLARLREIKEQLESKLEDVDAALHDIGVALQGAAPTP